MAVVRRCGPCGQFASVVIQTRYGPLAWHHADCARRYGMAAVR